MSSVTTSGLIGLSAYSVGFVLSLVSLALLLRNKRSLVAASLSVIGQALFLPIILIDLSGNFSSLPPPSVIPLIEIVTILVSLGTISLVTIARGSSGRVSE
jgi:hypothetical protein